jgi:hypothetical protein
VRAASQGLQQQRRYGYARLHDDAGNEIGACFSANKGERVIFMHAFSSDGLLSAEYPSDFTADVLKPGAHQQKSAELLYKTAYTGEDYHKAFNSAVFSAWLARCLVPAFEACYGSEKQMIVVCDNCSVHHVRPAGAYSPQSASKYASLAHLRNGGVQKMTLTIDSDSDAIAGVRFEFNPGFQGLPHAGGGDDGGSDRCRPIAGCSGWRRRSIRTGRLSCHGRLATRQ